VVVATAKLTPHVKHWIASRNIPVWENVKLPKNVILRTSAPMMNDYSGNYGSVSLSPKAVAPKSIFECPGIAASAASAGQRMPSRRPPIAFMALLLPRGFTRSWYGWVNFRSKTLTLCGKCDKL